MCIYTVNICVLYLIHKTDAVHIRVYNYCFISDCLIVSVGVDVSCESLIGPILLALLEC